jgi:hypothetical protein
MNSRLSLFNRQTISCIQKMYSQLLLLSIVCLINDVMPQCPNGAKQANAADGSSNCLNPHNCSNGYRCTYSRAAADYVCCQGNLHKYDSINWILLSVQQRTLRQALAAPGCLSVTDLEICCKFGSSFPGCPSGLDADALAVCCKLASE